MNKLNLALAATLLLGSIPCEAGLVAYNSFGTWQSRLNALNYNQRENLVYNDAGLDTGPAPTVQGALNQSHYVFDITNLDSTSPNPTNLVADAGGQARIQGEDTGSGHLPFTAIHVEPNLSGIGFLAFAFDIEFERDTTGDLTIVVYGMDGSTLGSLNLTNAEDGFYGVISEPSPASIIRSFDVISSEDVRISHFEKIRITEAAAVPEPSSLALAGIGAISCVVLAVRRRRHGAAAPSVN